MKHQSSISAEAWHSFKKSAVLAELNTEEEGLNSAEASKRLNFYGENKLPSGKKTTIWQIISRQLLSPLIFILIGAAIASIAISEEKDAIFIFLVILINSALGAYQEYNAEKSALSLQKILKFKAKVKRDGKIIEIESAAIVPGDIIFLESGQKVPADTRLLESSNLEIDESYLTGESIPAKKKTLDLPEDAGIADRINMAFAGATVVSGRGLGVVTSTGSFTQVGQIAQDVTSGTSAKPPLLLRMEKFIKQITILIIILSLILAIILRVQGMDFQAIFFFVIALAVSAIPEGLPVALTVALSIATRRMAKRNVIVRKLTSVESLGSCTVIASDKTGTLTVNQQTAKKIVFADGTAFSITGEGYNGEGKLIAEDGSDESVDLGKQPNLATLIRIAILANEANLVKEDDVWKHHGDAIDVALLAMGYKTGIDPGDFQQKYSLFDRISYESERKFSAVFWEENGTMRICAKGALETILSFCNSMSYEDSSQEINKEALLKQAEELAAKGYRILAFASGEYKDFKEKEVYGNEDIPALEFHGLVCFIDPLRSEAEASVQECRNAGIKVIMITGDHPATANTIALELGIIDSDQKVVSGNMLSEAGSADSPAYRKLVGSTSVFARVSPLQKLEIVQVLINDGEFVAVTGDGVNDAPALKRANLGVAMGSGTDVAKEVAAMIVIDDNFASIVAGVEEGRFAYDNVRKVIFLLISTGAAEVVLFILSIFAGLPLPLLAVQLLWLNLVTNGIQDVALAFEGGEPGTMLKKPRKTSETIFNPLMVKQTLTASITMGLIVFGLWFWLNNYTNMEETHARDLILLLMVFMQNFHALNCRSETVSIFKIPLKRNLVLIFGIIAAQSIHIISLQIPFMQSILRIEPITFTEWLYILTLAVPIILSMEIFKLISKKSSK